MDVDYLGPTVSALWVTVAILAGGFARTRNRSALAWFVLTVFLGPIAAFLLVVWPPVDSAPHRESHAVPPHAARTTDD